MTETAIVQVLQGSLRGKKVTSKFGTTYYNFLGVPYAKPPVGRLRFKAPQAPEKWEGIRDAQKEGATAPFPNILEANEIVGDEDCLFLNVYTPQIPDQQAQCRKPVMVWFHGGAFYIGSGNAEFNDPSKMMTGEVIVVTMNYRLGVLGFLSTGDSVVPGNNGLKDQVMALRWVQQNIVQFGGDPGNVTIFGSSAGGASVHFQLLTSLTEGLFHRALSMSGSAVNTWAFDNSSTARKKAFRLGETLGCKTTSSTELVNFLTKLSVEELLEGTARATSEDEKHPLANLFKPTNEVEVHDREEMFLPGLPANLMSEGKFQNVPFITGATSMEGMFVLRDFNMNTSWYEALNENFEVVITKNLDIQESTKKSQEIAQKVKEFYFGDKPICRSTLQQLSELYGDILFLNGIHSAAKKHQAKSTAPVYMYLFSYQRDPPTMPLFFTERPFAGVGHGEDGPYILDSPFFSSLSSDPESEDMKMSSKLLKMWITFAKTGNPNSDNSSNMIWSPLTNNEVTYLDINKEMVMKRQPMKDRLQFWEEIYTTLN